MQSAMASFYDNLADDYHLIFDDWDKSIERQAAILGPLLEKYTGQVTPRVLDCACGIGTQSIGLSLRGHHLVASDLSQTSVSRAESEAVHRGATIQFHLADMRNLSVISEGEFDAVIAADNAIPHLLLRKDRDQALQEMAKKLRPGGTWLATIRDYDRLLQTRPASQPPSFFGARGKRRIVHQLWDWEGEDYDLHLYLSLETPEQWVVKHLVSRYHALQRYDLSDSLRQAGFTAIQWLEPPETSFYQPIVIARKQ
jgi:glycine/sarcosine N-methyltransferase